MEPLFMPTDEQLKVIGEITVYLSHLANVIRLAISYLCGFESDKLYILLAPLSFRNLVSVFSNLVEENYSEDTSKLADLRGLVKNLGPIEEKRDAVTHSAWVRLATGKAFRFKIPRGQKKGRFQPVGEAVDIEALRAVDDRIQQLGLRVAALVAELSEAAEKKGKGPSSA